MSTGNAIVLDFYMSRVRYQFSSFTFDPTSGVLKRNHHELRIPQQTGLLLALLIERAGEIVTREQIQQALWSDGESIEYDQSINRAINNLRTALRDDAQNPTYVETFPKRGYSFVVPVKLLPETPSGNAPQPAGNLNLLSASAADPTQTETSSPGPSPAAPPPELVKDPIVSDQLSLVPAQIASRASATETIQRVFTRGFRPFASFKRPLWLLASALCVLLLITGISYILSRRQKAPSTVSLGVAPIEVQDPAAEQVAESFRLDLMDSLSQLPGLQLRASHSVERTRYNAANAAEMARAMNLDLLLLGKLTVQGDKYLLQFELVRARDSVHLASLQYIGTKNELPTICGKVQHDIFVNYDVSGKPIQTARGSTQNHEAYSAYLRAREQAYHRTAQSTSSALKHYQEAVSRDPTFARAYAGMATAYLATGSPDGKLKAQQAAESALKLDGNIAEGHAVLGLIAFSRDWDFVRGESELRQAIDAEPYQAAYHVWLAEILVVEGRFDESLQQIDLAHAEDPLWSHVYDVEIPVAGSARDYTRAVRAAQRYIELEPGLSDAHNQLGWTYFAMGKYEDAVNEWLKMAVQEKDEWRIALEKQGLQALHTGGVTAYGKLRLKAISDHPEHTMTHSNDFSPEEWEAFLGHKDEALAMLNKEIASHDASAMMIAINPMFDGLHHDPRFLTLLNRVGLKLPSHAKYVKSLSAAM